MVQMYVWLVVAVVLAVGVLFLAVAATRGDGSDFGDSGGPRTVADVLNQAWRDFRSGAAMLRARLPRRGRARSGESEARGLVTTPRGDGVPARVSVLPEKPSSTRRSTDAWSLEKPQDTTIEDFFAATQTSEPAYLDVEQVSNVLHRRR